MFSVEPKHSRIDPYFHAKNLQEADFDIKGIVQIEMIAFIILGLTLSLSAAQKKYFPLRPAFQEGIQMVSLIPLPITIFFEGLRQYASMANEQNGTGRSPN